MVIGGSDGPTAVFLAGKLGEDWFNPFGLFFILIMRVVFIKCKIKKKTFNKSSFVII